MFSRMNVLLVLLLVQLCTVFAYETSRSGTKNGRFRIISGRNADIEEFPYQAALERYGRQWCGGSVIAEDVIMTAAHCVNQMKHLSSIPPSLMQVRLGHSQSSTGGTTYDIVKVLPHERYDEDPMVDDFDIALVKVDRPIEFSDKVQPIELADEEPEDGAMAYVTGFGRQDPLLRRAPPMTRHLMAVEIPIMNRDKCRQIHGSYGNIVTDGMICAGYPSGSKDSCKGDSGGPLVTDDKLVGVVAWGMGCGRDGIPGVYTSVPKYREWIDANLERLSQGDRRSSGAARRLRPAVA